MAQDRLWSRQINSGNKVPRRPIIIALVLAALLSVAYAYWGDDAPQSYLTAPVQRGAIITVVRATGTINARVLVDVSSQLSGRIAEVPVGFNDSVTAGQVIAQLDPEIYVARANEAKAALSMAVAGAQLQKAALEKTKVALDNAGTARKVAESQLAAAKPRQDEADRDLTRNLKLSQSNAISDRELTQARTAREAGAAGLTALEDQIKMKAEGIDMARAELSMAEANVVNADAVVEQKRAALEQANVDLGRTEIRSPIDGVVIKREVNPGQTVAVNLEARMLFQIAKDLREMEVRGRIDEADVGRLQPGQTATFTVDAFPDRTFTGKVLQIRKAPEVVQNVVTYAAIVSAPNPELVLMPGMTANLRIVVSDTGDVLKIPNQALRFRPSQAPPAAAAARGTREATVWVLDNANQPSAMKITTGASDSAGTQVLSGALTEGQKVVIGLAAPDKPAQKLGLRLGF